MAKYLVTYQETLSRTVLVEAEDAHDAEQKVLDAVENETLVLYADDYLMESGTIESVEESCGVDEDCYFTL